MKYYVNGGNKLVGEITTQSAKNSVVALICATILTCGDVYIKKCPMIYDVLSLTRILRKMGAKVNFDNDCLYINTDNMTSACLPDKQTKNLRASLFMTGALLSRFGNASLCKPGGCVIGERPIDIHIDALKKLGAKFSEENGKYYFSCDKLKGTSIRLKYPSVGATENVMMAAVLASGVTVIENCAREPEIVDLQNFLNLMGAKIIGAGTRFMRIEGVKKLHGIEYTPIPDRIETGTFLLAVACCGGELEIKGTSTQNIYSLIEKLSNNACKIQANNDNIYIRVNNRVSGFGEIITSPYPGFPTDLQPILVSCASATQLGSRTSVKETVFEDRFKYVEGLRQMGANVQICGDRLVVVGSNLHGAKVFAPDLRGGAGLCIAGLVAEGTSEICNVKVIERGYENFVKKLSSIGAKIERK